MIFIKWATDWTGNLANAPSIITTLMNIFLNLGSVSGKPLFNLENAAVQESLQFYFLCVSLVCLPILLFPKPIITYLQHAKAHNVHDHQKQPDEKSNEVHGQNAQSQGEAASAAAADYYCIKEADNEAIELQEFKKAAKGVREAPAAYVVSSSGASAHNNNYNEKKEEHGFGDLFVHQSIETIEFTLGSISNTASYLRLWALSLAHAQLAKVFFDKALLGFVHEGSLIMVIIGFFIFANVTFFVLMCMDLMECFLHTLRLHWVEFQNKFFKADGRKFNPYDFSTLLEQ